MIKIFINVFYIIILIASDLSFAEPVCTGFEGPDQSGNFSIGPVGFRATFSGGTAERRPALYRNGRKSWLVDRPGSTGTITFETPATEIDLYFIYGEPTPAALLKVFDENDVQLLSQAGSLEDWTRVNVVRTSQQTRIKRVTLTNASGGIYSQDVVSAIDDICWESGAPGQDPVPPIASAGSDIVAVDDDDDGIETVSLDGSGSTDADGTISTFVWKADGQVIANGATANVDFALGVHDITLTVTDDTGLSDSDVVLVTVAGKPVTRLLTLSDVNGNSAPDVALVRLDRNTGDYRALIFDGATGDKIGQINFGAIQMIDAVSVEHVGNTDDIAIMMKLANDAIRVVAKNSVTGKFTSSLQFGPVYSGIDLASADIDNDGVPEFGVIGENDAELVRVLFRNMNTGVTVAQQFQGKANIPEQLLVSPSINGNPSWETVVRGRSRATSVGKIRVQDTSSSEIIRKISTGSLYASVDSTIVPDAAGPGQHGIAVVGVRDTGRIRVITRNASTAELVGLGFIRATETAIDIAAIDDVTNDNRSDIAVLLRGGAGKGRAWIYDTVGGALVRTISMTSIDSPRQLAISADIDGNDAQELVALGERNGHDRIVIYDSATGSLIKIINAF